MLPTVLENDHIFVNKAAYGLRFPFSHVQLAEFGGPERSRFIERGFRSRGIAFTPQQ